MRIFIILILILSITACTSKKSFISYDYGNGIVDCIKEAKLCPDGSSVSRVAPDCNFASCSIKEEKVQLTKPVVEFESRITKKKFGQYITEQNSPVQPERFSGFHTGVDVEYADIAEEVSVQAIADGTILTSRFASGYGGVSVIKHNFDNQDYYVVYGHLAPSSLLKVKSEVKQGDTIGILGKDKSSETDGERKHLHFAIYKGMEVALLGYVQNEKELKDWLDPIEFFKQN